MLTQTLKVKKSIYEIMYLCQETLKRNKAKNIFFSENNQLTAVYGGGDIQIDFQEIKDNRTNITVCSSKKQLVSRFERDMVQTHYNLLGIHPEHKSALKKEQQSEAVLHAKARPITNTHKQAPPFVHEARNVYDSISKEPAPAINTNKKKEADVDKNKSTKQNDEKQKTPLFGLRHDPKEHKLRTETKALPKQAEKEFLHSEPQNNIGTNEMTDSLDQDDDLDSIFEEDVVLDDGSNETDDLTVNNPINEPKDTEDNSVYSDGTPKQEDSLTNDFTEILPNYDTLKQPSFDNDLDKLFTTDNNVDSKKEDDTFLDDLDMEIQHEKDQMKTFYVIGGVVLAVLVTIGVVLILTFINS